MDIVEVARTLVMLDKLAPTGSLEHAMSYVLHLPMARCEGSTAVGALGAEMEDAGVVKWD